MTHLKRQNWFH